MLAPDAFATGMDWLLDRTVESCSIGVAFGQSSFTDLDFADDVSLLAELLELLVPILETIASEAASMGSVVVDAPINVGFFNIWHSQVLRPPYLFLQPLKLAT